jgi:hypothetical protein
VFFRGNGGVLRRIEKADCDELRVASKVAKPTFSTNGKSEMGSGIMSPYQSHGKHLYCCIRFREVRKVAAKGITGMLETCFLTCIPASTVHNLYSL